MDTQFLGLIHHLWYFHTRFERAKEHSKPSSLSLRCFVTCARLSFLTLRYLTSRTQFDELNLNLLSFLVGTMLKVKLF
jgi:hypothetical protein